MKGSFKLMAACSLTLAVASCKSLPADMLEGEWQKDVFMVLMAVTV